MSLENTIFIFGHLLVIIMAVWTYMHLGRQDVPGSHSILILTIIVCIGSVLSMACQDNFRIETFTKYLHDPNNQLTYLTVIGMKWFRLMLCGLVVLYVKNAERKS